LLNAERDMLDEYYEKLERWRLLQKEIKSRKPVDMIDDDLLLEFEDNEKPKHYLNGRKPVIACFFDDALGTRIYGPKSGLNNLTILHRHLGVSEYLGALGVTLIFASQSYKSNHYGISPTIRNNCTSIAVFKTKSEKELQGIYEEVAGFCTRDEFQSVYDQAMEGFEHNILYIHTSPKENNSNFRKNLNEQIYPK
jgi:hypothetical protein